MAMGSLHLKKWVLPLHFCLVLGLVSAESGATISKCMSSRLYWLPLSQRLDSQVDTSHFENAAIALIDEYSYDVKSLFKNQSRAFSAATAFTAAISEQSQFVPSFQTRIKQLSEGTLELSLITRDEAIRALKIEKAEVLKERLKPDSIYFKMVGHRKVWKENVVMLSQDGVSLFYPPRVARDESHTRLMIKRKLWPIDPKSDTKFLPAGPDASEEAKRFWLSSSDTGSERVGARYLRWDHADYDIFHYDRAAASLVEGRSYDLETLKKENIDVEASKAAFKRASWELNRFIPQFKNRVSQLAQLKGEKAELVPITPKEAGSDLIGYGQFFKLIRHTRRGTKENVVWLTPEGVSIHPPAETKAK